MDIPENQRPILWQAIEYWRRKNNLSVHHLSLLTAGRTKEPYPPDRIARGITDGSERITSDLLRAFVNIFGLVSARQGVQENILTDDEYIGLLTAPLRDTTEQGKFQI